MRVAGSDEGTQWYECMHCGRACDGRPVAATVLPGATAPRRPHDRPPEELRAIKAVRTLGKGGYGLQETLAALRANGWNVDRAHRSLQRPG